MVDVVGGGKGPGRGNAGAGQGAFGGYPAIVETQYATIYDLISAGEIEGIVGGYGGVFFNGVSLLDNVKANDLQARAGTVSVSASSTALTSAAGGSGADLFDGLNTTQITNNPRWVQIKNAGKTTTLSAAANEGSNKITVATNGFFTTAMTLDPITGTPVSADSPIKNVVRISGSGMNSKDGIHIITGINASGTEAYLSPAIYSDVASGATISIDHVSKLTAIGSGTTGTLETAAVRTVSGQPIKLSEGTITVGGGTGTGELTYENTYASFYNGTRYQQASPLAGTSPSATYTISPNFELTWHSSDNKGSTSGTSASDFITPDLFTFSQNTLEEVDKIKIGIEFPAGLTHNDDEGKPHRVFAEFQIVLHYKNDSSDASFKKVLVVGKDYGGADFDDDVPAWQTSKQRHRRVEDDLYGATALRKSNGVIERKGQSAAFIAEWSIDLTPFQPLADWQVEVKRMSPDSSTDYTYDDNSAGLTARLKMAVAEIHERFAYPLSNYAVIGFSAEDFQQPPSRAYHVRGRKIKVPTNYRTREEVGGSQAEYTRNVSTGATTLTEQQWDGKFRGDKTLSANHVNYNRVYCNNPAWVFYDILTDPDIGLGDFLEEEDIDIYALYRIARYCDELVPNGKGGEEPRFMCNAYLQKQEDAYKVLKDLASVFRGMIYWLDGKITPVNDSYKEAVYTFTNGNVVDGMFNYTYTGTKARINKVNVSWTDPEDDFKQVIYVVDDAANIISSGRIIEKDVVAFGCTSEAMAKRVGKWHLITDTEETEVVTFSTGVNGSMIRPGDWIRIQDHEDNGIVESGRTSSGSTTTSIVLDRTLTLTDFSSGSSHYLYLIYPEAGTYLAQGSATIDGVDYVRGDLLKSSGSYITSNTDALALVDDDGNFVQTQFSKNTRLEKQLISSLSTPTITVSSAFSAAPDKEVVWAVEKIGYIREGDLKTYRVFSLHEDTEKGTFEFTAGLVYDGKYEEVEAKTKVYEKTDDAVPGATTVVPPPTNVSVELVPGSTGGVEAGASTYNAVISWTPPLETFQGVEREYRYLAGFEIAHNLNDSTGSGDLVRDTVSGANTTFTISGVSGGDYTIRVRTVNTVNARSPWTTINRSIYASPTGSKLQGIAIGGTLSGNITFSTNKTVISPSSNFTYIPPSNSKTATMEIANASTAQVEQSFSAMSNDSTAYLYFKFDTDAVYTDPWKAVEIYVDNTVEDGNGNKTKETYFKEVGASSNGLSLASGTVSRSAAGSTLIGGTGSAFTTDFEPGDLIKFQSANTPGVETTSAVYGRVAEILTDNVLYLTKPLTDALTNGWYIIKQSFSPDRENDAILGKIVKSSAGNYTSDFFVLAKGDTGDEGQRGAGRWHISVSSLPSTSTAAQNAWDDTWADRPGAAVAGDQAWFYTGNISNPTSQVVWIYNGSTWNNQNEVIDGDLLVTGTITTDKISANAITTDKLAANSITADQIAANAITANEIAANSITANAISANSVVATLIEANSVKANDIAANAITSEKIAANAITANEIAANSITANAISANSVVSTLITANAVTATDISTTNLAAISANLGDITAGSLKGGTVPDADAGPSGTETGSFFDLDDGKFVVGNASKYILFDGTNLNLSGVVIESSTLSGTGAEITVKEDGTSEATDITTLDFTTGINVVAANAVATVSVDLAGLSTTNLSEGTNLYYTNARADARIALADIKSLANVKDWDNNNLAAGQLLIYDATETEFANATLTAGNNVTITNGDGAITIAATDTDTTYTAGTGLSLSNEEFSLNAVINDLSDVTIGTSASGQTLIWNNNTGNFVNATLSAGDNTTITSADGSITIASSDTTYTAGTGLSLSSEEFSLNASLTSLNDVTITTPAAGHVLIYDETATVFENAALSAGSNVTITNGDGAITIAATDTDTTYTAGTGLSLSNEEFSLNASLTSLNDVTITSPAAGHVLIYDATDTVFENATLTAGNNVTITNADGAITIAATDTNTTYSAGTGLSLSGTTFSLASSISGNRTFSNDVTISGNLTVSGTTTTLNVDSVTIEDNVIVVNSAQTGTPATSVTAGIEVERGDEANKRFLWAETGLGANSDEAGWTFGSDKVKAGTFYGNFVGDITGSPTTLTGLDTDDLAEGSTNLYFTDERAQDAVGTILTGSGATSVSYDDANGSITISSTDTNTFRPVSVDTDGDGTVNNTLTATETLVFKKGNNITLAETGGVITISSTDTNTTYTAATTSADGLMSAADKTKLDGVATGANAYSLPTASASTLGGIKVGSNLSISSGVLSATDTNTTYSASTGLSLVNTTFSHADTSSQASVNNSNGNVIQDVTLDGFGHVTALGSVDLDTRYYTESEMNQSIARIMGWEPAYNNSNESTVIWNITQDAVELLDPTGDTTVGMAYRAIYLEAGEKIRFTVTLKASAASTTGLYMRIYTYNGNLPDGKTHVSNDTTASSAFVQEDSSGISNFVENGAMPTGWTTYEYTYTQGTTGYASLVILNWSGFTGSLYVKQPHFDKLPVVSLTGSGATSISGSYPSFTISSTDTNTVYTHPNHSGDVTSTGDGATVIANDAVTNAKLANMAVSTIKGRATAGTGDPEDLTAAQVRALINVENGATADQTKAEIDALGINADQVDGVHAASFLRSDAADTLTSTLKVTGSIIHEFSTAGGYIARPKGAQYVTSTGAHTGAIKIKLPTNGTADMLSFWVDIYDYSVGESITLWIGGYLYQTVGNNEWVNETVLLFTQQTAKAPINVRFGADANNNCVWIGETTDTWSYPQIIVRDFQAGFSSDIDAYDDGWEISFVTTFDTVDEIRSADGPVTQWDRVEGKPTIPTNNNQLTNGAGYITGNQTITLSGPVTGSGTTSIATTLAADSVGASQIAANAVGASELNVSGNGTSGQALLSDGDGSFSWGSAGTTYSAGTGLTLTGTVFSLTNNATGSWFVDNLTANTINADYITANTISARELEISADSAGDNKMFFDGANNRIVISDGT